MMPVMMPLAMLTANYLPPQIDGFRFSVPASGAWADAPCGGSVNGAAASNVVVVDFKRKAHHIIAEATCASWHEIASKRLDRLRSYAPGWDGPASVAIDAEALARAGRLLEVAFHDISHPAPPSAVPCADGSLQLEWWLTDTRFELSISPDGSTYAWAENRLTDEEFEADDTAGAINLLVQWARRLTADKLVPAA